MNYDYDAVEKVVLGTKHIILSNINTFDIKLKGKADFVTSIDIAISEFVKTELKNLYPEVGFFSEEEDGHLSDNCWILDPIDGTTNLVYGYNMSSVSLAHYCNGEVVFGIVYNPFSDEIFSAKLGEGAYLNHQKRLHVSDRYIDEAIIEFGAGSTHKEYTDENFDLVKEIFKNCLDVRRICSSALDLCFIASGRIDGYFERVLKPWDIAAGYLILREAHGVLTDYHGDEVQFAESTSVVASNGKCQKYLLETIAKHTGR